MDSTIYIPYKAQTIYWIGVVHLRKKKAMR